MIWGELGNQEQSSAQAYARWQAARNRLQSDVYLIQACYANADKFRAALSDLPIHKTLAITLRVITTRAENAFVFHLAYLELPRESGAHAMFRIDLSSGQLVRARHRAGTAKPTDNDMLDIWTRFSLTKLPHWKQAAFAAALAHGTLAPDLYSVAWDFLLTDEGALMLEGNSTWGVIPPQILAGGLLKNSV